MNNISKTAIIGQNVTLGDNVTICNNVIIYDNVTIGDNVYIWDNVVIGKKPMGVSTNFRKLQQEDKPITIGNNCVIACGAIIYQNVKIGDNCLISEHAIIREDTELKGDDIIGGGALIQYGVTIGERTRILNNSIISSKSKIGKNNFISWGVSTVSDKHFGNDGYTEETVGPVIGDNNSLGPNVTVLSNISIGNNNTIGACALISKTIGDNGVYYGVPAKLVKTKEV